MNIYDAIENIELCVRYAMSDCNTTPEEDAEDEEALTIAIEAMKKQEPMKLVRKWKNLYCPNCDQWILWDDVIPNKTDNYCGICGQKLDWEEEKP